ncbi:MAG: ABC transporter ATP-binding protein [Tissierellia bacterium]|nr:ABC transporter ATP-binding protein [Tissierellia bacterium]
MLIGKGLLKYSGRYKFLTIFACILSIISSVMSIIPLVCIFQIIKLYIMDMSKEVILHYGVIAIISSLISIILYFIGLSMAHISAFRVAKNLKLHAIHKLIDMPLGFFELRATGELRKTIDENTMLTEDFLAHKLPDFAATIVMPFAIIISFFYYDWRMGVVCFIPLVIAFICLKLMMGGSNKTMMGRIMTMQEEMDQEAVEYVRGIPIIKVFQQTVFSFKKFHKTIIRYRDLVAGYAKSCRMPKTLFSISLNSFFVLLILVAAFLFHQTENKSEVFLNLIFFILLSPLISTTLMRLMLTGENLIQAKEALSRIENITEDKIYEAKGLGDFPSKYNISFDHVSFSYPEQKTKVLKNISFSVEENSKVAIVGLSGSGKSTVLSLIGKFFEVDSGEIKIGDKNIKEIDTKSLMENVSFVFQESKLFPISLLDNIKIGRKDATMEEVEEAIKITQCEDIIQKFPEGLQSIYGTKGIYLSGGERQRIALARAFIKDSPIIVFDEATSGCDAENEFYINEGISKISKNKTVVLVAHRLNSVVDADKIIVMDHGKILEKGNHKQLLENDGLYRKMWNQYVESSDWRI